MTVTFTGTGVQWIGPKNTNGGIAAADAGRRRRCRGPRATGSADKTLRSGAAHPRRTAAAI